MERTATTMLRIGTWCVNPGSGQISRDGESARLEARTMRLLVCLAEHAGEVVSIDELLDQVWAGVIVSPDSVYQAVTSLRRLLGDDPKNPTYIATVPRLGYRMVAPVSVWDEQPVVAGSLVNSEAAVADSSGSGSRFRVGFIAAIGVGLLLAVGVFFGLRVHDKAASKPVVASSVIVPQAQKSIAVLPFSDLTEGMKQGEFADGMTEELIDRLSKLPDLRVSSPTSVFYYRDKQMQVADIAKALGVVYVLDGSVRKAGARVRVAARLIRADNGYVVWTESYDRPFNDILMVQDDIASEVTKALKTSTEFKAR
jgi:transcriptional activator of cad operon